MNLAITPDQAASVWYQKALQYELFVGRASNPNDIKNSGINHPEILAYKGRILGNRSSVAEYADWTEFLLRDFGPRKHCLSLGSGLGRVEQYLMRIGFTERFEAIELCANENELLRFDSEKVNVLKGDLNFTELAENSYDFILCHGVLHHLINLEYILDQINRALKADGILMIYEYIGETRWQFTDERMNFVRSRFPHLKMRVPRPWEVRGFESVRSGDLMELLTNQFGAGVERSVSYGGVFFPLVICAPGRSDNDIRAAVEADAIVSANGAVPPCYHMGIYRKSERPATIARKWSDSELRDRVTPKSPIVDRAIWSLRQSAFGGVLRTAKRAILP